MCNCAGGAGGKDEERKDHPVPRNIDELIPQDQLPKRPNVREGCCKVKRVLVYEDETEPECSKPDPPTPPSPPPRPPSPPSDILEGIKSCQLAGVAIVRRRIDVTGISGSEKKTKEEDKDKGKTEKKTKEINEEKESEKEPAEAEAKPEGEDTEKEKENEGESSEQPVSFEDEQTEDMDKERQASIANSTPLPGHLDAKPFCDCSAISKS